MQSLLQIGKEVQPMFHHLSITKGNLEKGMLENPWAQIKMQSEIKQDQNIITKQEGNIEEENKIRWKKLYT